MRKPGSLNRLRRYESVWHPTWATLRKSDYKRDSFWSWKFDCTRCHGTYEKDLFVAYAPDSKEIIFICCNGKTAVTYYEEKGYWRDRFPTNSERLIPPQQLRKVPFLYA
jgi:hypothetical protein